MLFRSSNYGLFVAADASQLKEVNRRAEIDATGSMCTEGIIKGNEKGGFVCIDVYKRQDYAPNLDVHIIPDTVSNAAVYQSRGGRKKNHIVFSVTDTLKSTAILILSSLVGMIFQKFGFDEANIITVFVDVYKRQVNIFFVEYKVCKGACVYA